MLIGAFPLAHMPQHTHTYAHKHKPKEHWETKWGILCFWNISLTLLTVVSCFYLTLSVSQLQVKICNSLIVLFLCKTCCGRFSVSIQIIKSWFRSWRNCSESRSSVSEKQLYWAVQQSEMPAGHLILQWSALISYTLW